MSTEIKTIQTLLDMRADIRLKKQIAGILQPLQRHIEAVSGYPKIAFDGKERTMDNAFVSAVSEALFKHSRDYNRSEAASQFVSDTESFRPQLEDLQAGQQ